MESANIITHLQGDINEVPLNLIALVHAVVELSRLVLGVKTEIGSLVRFVTCVVFVDHHTRAVKTQLNTYVRPKTTVAELITQTNRSA